MTQIVQFFLALGLMIGFAKALGYLTSRLGQPAVLGELLAGVILGPVTLTLTLLLWFVYLAYLLLRSFTDGDERTARFASIYGIVGVVLIPLNYWIIDLVGGRAQHPQNIERGSLGEGMGLPFLLGNLTFFFAFVYLLLLRWRTAMLRSCEDRP